MPTTPARVPFIIDLLTAPFGRDSIAVGSPQHLHPFAGEIAAPETGGMLYVNPVDSTLRFVTADEEITLGAGGGGAWGDITGALADQEDLAEALAEKAPLESPAFTGAVTIGGETAATRAYVAAQISALVDSSPGALDTLNELAAALGDDPAFATTTATSLGNRLRVDGAQAFSSGQRSQALDNLGAGATGKLVLAGANAGAIRTTLGLVVGTDVQAYHAQLAALAAYATNGMFYRSGANTFAQVVIGAGIGFAGGVLTAKIPIGTVALMPPQTGDSWLLADTTPRSKTTYSALYDAVAYPFFATCTTGSDVITLSSEIPAHFRVVGASVLRDDGGFYTVTDVSTPGQLTVTPAPTDDILTGFRVFLAGWGNNDADTFACGGYVGSEPNPHYGLRFHVFTGR